MFSSQKRFASADMSHKSVSRKQAGKEDNPLWSRFALQTKMNTGHADDDYEREADTLADRVMHMPDQHGDTVQRQPMEEEEEELQP